MRLKLKQKQRKLSLSREQVKPFSAKLAKKMREEGVTELELLVLASGKGDDAAFQFADMKGLPAEFVKDIQALSEDDLEEVLEAFEHDEEEVIAGAIRECMGGKKPRRGKMRGKQDEEEEEEDEATEEDEKAADYEANTIKGVEIFAAGKHNGDLYSTSDLDSMVSAFNKLDYRPALKVGHTKKPGHPAYGYIENLRRVGTKLVADFTNVADEVMEYIRKKMFDRVSAEVYWNFQRGDQKYKRALKAVALLGAEVPGVAGLKPLHEAEFDADDFEEVKACDSEIEIPEDAFYSAVTDRMKALTKHLTQEKGTMSKRQKQELEEQLEALQEQVEGMENGDSKELQAQVKSLEKRLKDLQDDKDSRDLKERVEKLRVPAFKSQIEAMYRFALAADSDDTVEIYTTDGEGKRKKQDVSLLEAVDSLVESVNKQAEKLFKSLAGSGMQQRPENDDNAAARVHTLTQEYMSKHPEAKLTYSQAMGKVLAGDKQLKADYEAQMDARQ